MYTVHIHTNSCVRVLWIASLSPGPKQSLNSWNSPKALSYRVVLRWLWSVLFTNLCDMVSVIPFAYRNRPSFVCTFIGSHDRKLKDSDHQMFLVFRFQAGDSYVTEDCSQLCECTNTSSIACVSYDCDVNSECILRNGVRGCFCQDGYRGDGLQCEEGNLMLKMFMSSQRNPTILYAGFCKMSHLFLFWGSIESR